MLCSVSYLLSDPVYQQSAKGHLLESVLLEHSGPSVTFRDPLRSPHSDVALAVM